ncbi:MAG: type II secretion system protein [Sulfurospirillum sp.]|nr:type II secretion system protein [Sulfurospirillum sp.]MBL0703126.1 type II secretion system protein [Sulfurospirillum sp.]
MRSGFSLLIALLFLVLIATLSALSLSLSTKSTKQTTDIFLKNQAELLIRSGTEFAMLAISGHDYSASCLNTLNITYPNNETNYTHEINITISYIGRNLPINCIVLDNNISTLESNKTVIIDTVVSTNPILTPNIIPEQIRMHRRSIQKP